MPDPLIGRQLANFRIEHLIGRGGMAQVYYGWDVKLERPVAIKMIDTRFQGDPVYARRFVQEARTVATWHHDNIIQVYYADKEDELYYFVMEYIDGQDLGALIGHHRERGELMPQEHVLGIGRAVASALDYAHQRDVIHRDVKPANVMVAQDGRVVLSDFGLALDVQQGSLGEAFGSSHYIAPEQARRSADAVPQSDLYALGVILYEMLTGFVPFDDPSPTTVALQHITQPPPPPRQINPKLNAETEAVLLKALSKSPDERYQTGATLIDALEHALQGQKGAVPVVQSVSGDEDSLIGHQLDEYRLESLLGKGGMARIYRGFDVRVERHVSIKVMDVPLRDDPDYIMRFEREARAIAQLEHPHIVRLYRYGEADGLLYMAMQYVEGADLETVLSSYQKDEELLKANEIARIIGEICQALDYAHEKGVIHRDVKPSNILLDRQGRAFLTDFGLALLTEVGTRGEIFGSPHYIAPEQAVSSADVVPQSDLYALGVILYELFTNQLPFNAADPLDIAMLHLSESPRPPRELRPELSPELEAVILKAMAKEPQDRYPSGAALAEALNAAVAVPAPAPPPKMDEGPSIPEQVELDLTRPAPPPPDIPRQEPGEAAPLPDRRGRMVKVGGGLIGLVALLALVFVLTRDVWEQQKAQEHVASPLSPLAQVSPTSTSAQPRSGSPVPTTASATPSPSPTHTATATPSPSPTQTATPSPSPTKTATTTNTPSATPSAVPVTATAVTNTPQATRSPTPSATPTPPVDYRLRLLKNREDSLFVVNESQAPFPLARLCLGNCDQDKQDKVDGTEWELASLDSGGCVAIWKSTGRPVSPPDADCEPVGERLNRSGRNIFWASDFGVYYAQAKIGTCQTSQCIIDVSAEKPNQPILENVYYRLYLPLIVRQDS